MYLLDSLISERNVEPVAVSFSEVLIKISRSTVEADENDFEIVVSIKLFVKIFQNGSESTAWTAPMSTEVESNDFILKSIINNAMKTIDNLQIGSRSISTSVALEGNTVK